MHGDEGELEAAGEEADHQQHVAAVAEGLGQRVAERLRRGAVRRRRCGSLRGVDSTSDSGTISAISNAANIVSVDLPAEQADQRDRERRKQKLSERAGRGAEAEGGRAPLRRHQLAERANHDGESTARQAEADQDAGRRGRASAAWSNRPSNRGQAP